MKHMLTRQWSFFWAGVAFGAAQLIYMIALWIQAVSKGKPATLNPITVTSDLGAMYRSMEVGMSHVFGMPDFQLYGNATAEGLSMAGGAFAPGVGWQIIGMIVGGLIVALLEKESRVWVKYSAKVLWVAFVGGMLFSYGTRLAGGCTLNHLLGGMPLMSIHSFVTVAFMAIGGALGFGVMEKLKLAKYFKHQETKSYCEANLNDKGETVCFDPNYKPFRRPIFWISAVFLLLFLGFSMYGGLFNPEWMQHLDKKGDLKSLGKSIADAGVIYAVITMLAGIVAGFGLSKSGFGTECALVSLEVAGAMRDNDNKFAKMGVPRITRTLMRGYLPIIGVTASWVMVAGFVWLMWVLGFAKPGFEGGLKEQLTMGNVWGGLLIGFGAVLLIGCEIRSYMRVGMGYLNTWVGMIGFAIGYLPFTMNFKAHTAYLESTRMTETYKVYQWAFPDNIPMQQAMMGVWVLLLTGFLLMLIRMGSRNTGMSRDQVVNLNTEDLQLGIDAQAGRNRGMSGEFKAPTPAPFGLPQAA